MKRVVAVIPNYLGGGAETVTDAIVAGLKPEGYEFVLVTEQVVEKCREHVNALYSKVIIADFELARYSSDTSRRLARIIEPLRADTLWMIGDEFADIDLLRSALKPGGKVVYHLHSIPFFQVGLKDTFHGNPSDRAAYAKWFMLKHMREKLFKSYARRYARRARLTAAGVDTYVTLCEAYAETLRRLAPDQAAKIVAVHNPAPPFTARHDIPKRRELLYVGRLSHADKRVDRLIDIFAGITDAHPGWKLKIVGDGPERANLERRARDLGLERIEFCGFSANPAEHFESASIVCMTSALEGWGMVLVEAMQHGAAPIAFGCSEGVRTILADGRGIIVNPDDMPEYMNRLSQLMASPDLRAEITSTHAPFLAGLSADKIIEQWKRLL